MGVCGTSRDGDAVLDGATISTAQANYGGDYTYGEREKGAYRENTVPVDDPGFRPITSDCLMCTAMFGSGCRTATSTTMGSAHGWYRS